MRVVLILSVVFLAGCTSVAPYQKGYLARSDMALEDSPGMVKALEKVFVAKEAATGSATVGGSGCGCN